ncbi:MAG: hypothetical protein FWE21_05315 [Defluviitaleaceae bacterium]|nr:hypothetical protein [Defluviitaleaceae bacterium]
MTVEQLLNELEKPENHDQIQHLANLGHLQNLDELKEARGLVGFFSRIGLAAVKGHTNAIIALSECEDVDDIRAFRHSGHYAKIKSVTIQGANLEDLAELAELAELRELKNLNI